MGAALHLIVKALITTFADDVRDAGLPISDPNKILFSFCRYFVIDLLIFQNLFYVLNQVGKIAAYAEMVAKGRLTVTEAADAMGMTVDEFNEAVEALKVTA